MALPQSISLTSSFGTGKLPKEYLWKNLSRDTQGLTIEIKTRSGNMTEGFSHRTGWSRSKEFW